MKLAEALAPVRSAQGMTTVLAGIQAGDFQWAGGGATGDKENASLKHARERLAQAIEAKDNCKSEWAYWGHQGNISMWSAVVDILTAAEIVGPDNLPDVSPPGGGGVVMDAQYEIVKYGRKILQLAKKNGPNSE